MTTVVSLRHPFDLSNPATLMLDLASPKPGEVLSVVEAFEADIKAGPDLGPLPVTTGWADVTPDIAVNLLRRNRPGANRKVDPNVVLYYASQMAKGQWMATGQPVLVDANGRLVDAQHRLLAVVVSGTTIKTFVVTDIEAIPNLFAYIDNAKSRSAATALQTAGFNGVAGRIVQLIKVAEEVKHGVYNPSGIDRLPRMAPVDVLGLIQNYPNAQKAARSAASDWDAVVAYLCDGRYRDGIGYLGMRIIDLHGEEVADDFFEDLMDASDRPADDPIAAFRKEAEKDNRSAKPMKKAHMLGALIKVFNAWHRNELLGRRWMLQVNEDFPVLDDSPAGTPTQSEAAE